MLLVASYVFYGFWDWRFLSLIWTSTIVDYFCGLRIHDANDEKRRKFFLVLSVCTNLGLLGFFKYFNFFVESFQDLVSVFGWTPDSVTLNIVLPVGISFYTFQTMSYTIDIYRGRLEPTKRFLDFGLFVAFFPQLVAGPIERGVHLLPQVLNPRRITRDQFYEGLYLICWGLFKKVFIADNLARMVDPIFAQSGTYHGPMVLLALYAFAFQIYCDFSGYSDIARGLGKCMGFDLMLNFNLPYFSTNPAEFWRRWHISLSTWLRDYLYIPLGGNRKGKFKTYRNLALTMVIGGLWHGANWTFFLWGTYHGFLLIVHRLIKPYVEALPKIKNALLKNMWFAVRILFFFHLVCFGWLLFRAQSVAQVTGMIDALLFDYSIGPEFVHHVLYLTFFAGFLIYIQIFQFYKQDLSFVVNSTKQIKLIFLLVIFYLTLYVEILGRSVNVGGGSEFIYFQF